MIFNFNLLFIQTKHLNRQIDLRIDLKGFYSCFANLNKSKKMVVLSCPIAQCNFQTADVEVIGAAAILNIHAQDHTYATAYAASNRVPKLERPRLELNSTQED